MFGQKRKSPEKGKKIGHCVRLQQERRKREALANSPIPRALHRTGGGRKKEGGGSCVHTCEDWGTGPERLAGRKELAWREISTNCMGIGYLFQDGHSQGYNHHQAEATWAVHSVRTLPHIYHLTLSDIPTPWSSETDGHSPLCGPNCVTAISSNSICGSFNAIKMGTKGEGSALLLGWDRQWWHPSPQNSI